MVELLLYVKVVWLSLRSLLRDGLTLTKNKMKTIYNNSFDLVCNLVDVGLDAEGRLHLVCFVQNKPYLHVYTKLLKTLEKGKVVLKIKRE